MKNLKDVLGDIDEDLNTCTCQIISSKSQVNDVQFSSFIGATKGFILVPAVGSNVMISFINKEEAFVANAEALTGLKITFENGYFLLTEDAFTIDFNGNKMVFGTDDIQFNDGTLAGLVTVNELVSQLNTIENDINTLKQAFTAWVPVPQDGGAALKGGTAAWSGQTLTPTQASDIENEKILQ